MTVSSALVLLAVLALPVGPPPAGQDEDSDWNDEKCAPYTIEQLDAGVIPLDDPAYVDVKYASYTGRIRALVAQAHLQPQRGVESSQILRLRRGDNIRVYGRYQGPTGKPGMFHVYRIQSLPSDEVKLFNQRRKIADGDVEARLKLGDWAMARHAVYGAHVEPVREKAIILFNEAVDILEKKAAKDDAADKYEQHLEIAKIIQERIGDRGRALDKLKETCLKLRPDDPDLKKYIGEEVGAVWYRGDWVKYEEFKTAEGFLQRSDGTWVREPVFYLEKFLAKKPQPFGGTVGDAQAKGGQIHKGLKPYQMIWAKRAYPEYILRIADSNKAEVWVYPKAYYLFWNDKYYEQQTRNAE